MTARCCGRGKCGHECMRSRGRLVGQHPGLTLLWTEEKIESVVQTPMQRDTADGTPCWQRQNLALL